MSLGPGDERAATVTYEPERTSVEEPRDRIIEWC